MTDRPEHFEGVITIEWTPGPSPMQGWRFAPRTEDGELITTVTELTIHASAEDVVWAETTMFADKDGKMVRLGLDGPKATGIHIGADGKILTGTFPFLVGGMTVREPRKATFAGFLGLSDYSAADGMVSISIQPAGGVAMDRTTTRSARPFTVASFPWVAENAGLGAEDIGRKVAAEAAPAEAARAGLPGDSLEVWSLPVTSFVFEYLITPAGDWPPEPRP